MNLTTNKNEENKFKKADDEGREIALQYLIKYFNDNNFKILNTYLPIDVHSTSDIHITIKTKDGREINYLIECKNRNMTSTKFKSDMIEINKFYNLITSANQYNQIPLYINTFTDNVATVHNLTNMDCYTELKTRKKTTVEDRGDENTPVIQIWKNEKTKYLKL